MVPANVPATGPTWGFVVSDGLWKTAIVRLARGDQRG
jgi:hypothetical protein